MDVFLDFNLFSALKLMTLQCVQRYKKIYYLFDILCADGRSVRRDMISNAPISSTWNFSLEQPTRQNFKLWKYVIHSVTSSQLTLEALLGNYLSHPHNTGEWYTSADK